jgi:hypothetical protein
MHHLPNETVCHIFKFVKDRIPVSRTCKKWDILLNDMYKQKLLSDINDPYYFKKYFDEVGLLKTENDTANISEHKCLNYICEKLYNINVYVPVKFGNDLIIKNCQVNNVSKPKWIYRLYRNYVYDLPKIIDTCLKYKAYDMLVILIFHDNTFAMKFKEQYILHYYYETNIDVIICDLEIIMSKNILTITQIYKLICVSNIFLRKPILAYLEAKINPEILRLIKY